MKKVLFLLILSIVLVGCDEENISQNKNAERVIEADGDEVFLKDIQDEFSNTDYPSGVLLKIEGKYDELSDQEIKNKVLEVYNESVLKMLEAREGSVLYNIFYQNNTDELQHEDYLFEDVMRQIIQKVNPVHYVLLENNLTREYIKKYNEEIQFGKDRSIVLNWLSENGIRYEFIGDVYSDLLVISDDNLVIELDEKVKNMYIIKDKEGNTVNPNKVLENLALELVEKNKVVHKEKTESLREEIRESKSISIGMTTDEVLAKWGKPKDINKTITKYGTSEQWVYPDYQYVYFKDGIVDAIQQ